MAITTQKRSFHCQLEQSLVLRGRENHEASSPKNADPLHVVSFVYTKLFFIGRIHEYQESNGMTACVETEISIE